MPILFLLPFIISPAALLQEANPRVLAPSDLIPLQFPPFSVTGDAVCDAKGNFFSETIDPKRPQVGIGPFIRTTFDGRAQTSFDIPGDILRASKNNVFAVQAVAPGGIFCLLVQSDFRPRLFAYRNDGTETSRHTVDLPAHFIAERLAVTDLGIVYVRGYINGPETQDVPHKPFAGVFATTGELLRDLSGGLQNFSQTDRERSSPDGDAVGGQDGRFYLLDASRVTVLTAQGEVERTLTFEKPEPRATASRIEISGGLISIELTSLVDEAATTGAVIKRYLVLDAQSGEQRGYYILGDGVHGSALCFSRERGYTQFLRQRGRESIGFSPLQ